MTHQTTFAQAEFSAKKKRTRREEFLARMEEVIPWGKLLAVIAPHYPKGERGRPPMGLERMLRVYFLQQWYGLADEALEDALYDSQALQRFARIELGAEGVPDATTLLKFRRLLESHDLCKALFTAINADLAARGLLLREGTLVDATLIAAPTSTKNEHRKRDPEMHQTKKGNQWYFGLKAHIGADRDSKLVHTVVVTAANVADVTQTAALLHGEETEVHAEAGFKLNGSLLREGLVDELLLYLAPCLIGHAASGVSNLPELATLDGKRRLQIRDLRQVGEDIRLIARPR